VLTIPRRIIRAASEKRNAIWRPADNHGSKKNPF
jgi:hypothetical protein